MKYGLALLAIIISCDVAAAGNGPCGIDLGTWGDSKKRCEGMRNKHYGEQAQDGYMVFRRGGQWEQWESYCTIRTPMLKGNECTYRLLCQVEGQASVETVTFRILDAERIAFVDAGKAGAPYYYCFGQYYTPYKDKDN